MGCKAGKDVTDLSLGNLVDDAILSALLDRTQLDIIWTVSPPIPVQNNKLRIK